MLQAHGAAEHTIQQIGSRSRLQPLSIAIKELIPVVLAAATWGSHWSGKIVLFRVDNMAVVEAINTVFCKDVHLIRLLVFFASYHSFWFYADHVAVRANSLVDVLSKNSVSMFLSQSPSKLSSAINDSSIINHPCGSKSHMDIHQLDAALHRYFAAALASSTHKTYAAAERRYLNFCKDFNLLPLPTSKSTLCYFVACLGQQGLAHSTISPYLSGVRQLQSPYRPNAYKV